MSKNEIILHFDLDNEMENRVYFALKNLPHFLSEPNLSKAVILFVDNAVNTIGECEERAAQSEKTLKEILGQQSKLKMDWN